MALAHHPVRVLKAASKPPSNPVARSSCPPCTPINSWPTLAESNPSLELSASQAALYQSKKPPISPAKKAPQLFLANVQPAITAIGTIDHHGSPK